MKTSILTTIWTTVALATLIVSSACAGPVTKAPASVVSPAPALTTTPAPTAPSPAAPEQKTAPAATPTAPSPAAPEQKTAPAATPKPMTPAAEGKTDLLIENMKITPGTVKVGEPVKVTVSVTNFGDPNKFTLQLKVNGKVVDEEALTCTTPIDCLETKDVTFDVKMSAPGTYTLTVGDSSGRLVVQ